MKSILSVHWKEWCWSWKSNTLATWCKELTPGKDPDTGKDCDSPLDCKEIQPVHSKGNQSWIFIGRTDAEAENPILWLPDAKSQSLEKTLMMRKTAGRRRWGWQGMRWHHRFNGPEFEQTPGDREGQGSLCAAVHGVHVRHNLASEQQQDCSWINYSILL